MSNMLTVIHFTAGPRIKLNDLNSIEKRYNTK